MSRKNKPPTCRLMVIIPTIILTAMLLLQGCKKQPSGQTPNKNNQNKIVPAVVSANKTKQSKTDVNTRPKQSLRDIVRQARTWGPAYSSWFGQKAPDFTLVDINGKLHKLSDYKGKNVIIIFWATWCAPCVKEIPHLIALRNLESEDKLAILAISYITTFPRETAEKVKNFVEKNNINYTAFSARTSAMPPPYNRVSSIPCNFFIDPDGKIKLATEGLMSLGDIKAILNAE